MLKFSGFQKSFGSRLILDVPDLKIPDGLHWIRGKNGSGKSTLFRCLAGLSPYSGSISLNGLEAKNEPLRYRGFVGYAEAEPVFPSFLSGKEIFEFAGAIQKTAPGRMEEIVRQLSLDLYYEQPSATYSSGMLKKIALAMAFLGQAQLIILDEPLITLDTEACLSLWQMISEERCRGTGFLISSHPDFTSDQIRIDHSWLLENGRLISL
jgi:ABC-2 type transport system ATP-binding protein